MVEVFKTNVNAAEQSNYLMCKLLARFPESRINFDLEDCDRILRVESQQYIFMEVAGILNGNGFLCEVLE